MRIFLIILSLWAGGCSALSEFTIGGVRPGTITENISSVGKEITLKPAWLSQGNSDIKLGLYKNLRMERDDVVLIVVVRGAHFYLDKRSLEVMIDGEKFSFDPIDITDVEASAKVASYTYFSDYDEVSQRYLTKKGFIRKLIDARDARVRVNRPHGFVEGPFSNDDPKLPSARFAFKEFYKKAWEQNAK